MIDTNKCTKAYDPMTPQCQSPPVLSIYSSYLSSSANKRSESGSMYYEISRVTIEQRAIEQ